MNPADRIAQAARLLAELHRPGPGSRALPPELSPRNEPEAYEIQRHVAGLLGLETGGWKVAMMAVDRGRRAPIFKAHLYHSPARAAVVRGEHLGVEPEVAFTFKRDLPRQPQGLPYTREQLLDAIDAAFAAIEIVVSRLANDGGDTPLEQLADNLSNAGLVLSRPCGEFRQLDWRALPLRLTLAPHGGEPQVFTGSGAPLGDPLIPLLWLVNERAAAGDAIRAGEPVTTGSYAGLHAAAPGTLVSVEFAGLGVARLEVS